MEVSRLLRLATRSAEGPISTPRRSCPRSSGAPMMERRAGRMQALSSHFRWATLDDNMRSRVFALLLVTTAAGFAGDWDKRLAADYLDARQKAWLAWPTANKNGVPCVSCHTGVTYLLARPALRQA